MTQQKKISKNFRLLIAYGSQGKYFHLKEFSDTLNKIGLVVKLVSDIEYSNGFPSKNPLEWISKKKFKKLINDFKPDAVFVDRQTHFGKNVIEENIPLFVLLRGHYWDELEWAKKTIHTGIKSRIILNFRNKIAEKIFQDSTAIFPICKFLEDVVKEHHPKQQTHVFSEGIDAKKWYKVEGLQLNHPCVGLIQDANWWGKTKEMLILKDVLKKMPHVTFYWVGGGIYAHKILNELKDYQNFIWLERLPYPDKIREFLSEIDIYALISGMDLAPLTLKEAQLMKKPVIATDVGGIPEMMKNNETGFLVEKENAYEIIKKISILLNDKDLANRMGNSGRKFIIENFSWELIANRFLQNINIYLKK